MPRVPQPERSARARRRGRQASGSAGPQPEAREEAIVRRKVSGGAVPQPAAREEPIVRLQRSAGNRAVARLLSGGERLERRTLQREARAASAIAVRKGSKLTAAGFLEKLTKNSRVPAWLRKSLGSSAGSLVMTGKPAPPKNRIWLFVDPLEAAFKSGGWDITTARSRIEVTRGADGKRSWRQLVTPDLAPNERIGYWMKSGPDERTFSPTILNSESEEIIYGWTVPATSTNLQKDKRNLIVIVTEIEVTAPDGKKTKTKTFHPDGDTVAEAILHEISIHAGRISQGQPDVHDHTNAVIRDLVDQVGGFFRPLNSSDELEPSKLTKEIFKFAGP